MRKTSVQQPNTGFNSKHRLSKSTTMPNAAERNTILKNRLLASLPVSYLQRIEPMLELVSFEPGQILYESNKRTDYAYFPTTAVISLLYTMENGASVSVSVVGNEGMIGIALIMGAETVPNEAIVQCSGEAFRIKYWQLQREFKFSNAFQKILLHFTMAMLEQASQIAACNRLHPVEKQLCRWLLLTQDRLDSNDLIMTHDLIAHLLGVSREGISLAIKQLKQRRLIENVRGTVTIIDRQGMEALVCECYQRISKEYKRLLGK
jgi:CRP-like cAMP-binding protein